jgi:hypothetical protein
MGRHHPRLVHDATGDRKIELSLPGGRYQLSLTESGVALVKDGLNAGLGDDLPVLAVRALVATGDASFPSQRDYRRILDDLSAEASATPRERAAVADYLRSRRVREARLDAVHDVVEESALGRNLDVDEIEVRERPSVPDGIFDRE